MSTSTEVCISETQLAEKNIVQKAKI